MFVFRSTQGLKLTQARNQEKNWKFTTIDDPNATGYTNVTGIYGDAVVGTYLHDGIANGFVDILGRKCRHPVDGGCFYTVDVPDAGAITTSIQGITRNGIGYDLVGAFQDNTGQHGFLLYWTVPVPEPSTWFLMLIGFGGLGLAAFRRGRKDRRAIATA